MNTIHEVLKEFFLGFKRVNFWGYLGWNDIRNRYRRSVIGPIWVTLSMAIFIAALGLVYSRLFKMDMGSYLPYLSAGYVVWILISTTLIESSYAFTESAHFIKDIKVPLMIFVLRQIWRNLIVFLHNCVVVIVVYIYFHIHPGVNILYLFPGLILLTINLLWISLFLAILGSAYRDIGPMVQSVIQVLFFVSPIAWLPKLVGENSKIVKFNLVNYLIDLIRQPLLGYVPSIQVWDICIAMAIVGWLLTMGMFIYSYKKVVYWI